ncbi:iron ABC transporter ATP-binding protein [Nostoc sp. 3335mG]|nr:iron ABC transporter ATP-binding protein [Nostoc sp. 3335mG]
MKVVRGGRDIVRAASLSAPKGAVTALVGPNGAGKSTLLGAVMAFGRADAGTVDFDGADLRGMDRRARARLCAFVEQSAHTEERLTVADVVALGRIPHGAIWTEAGAETAGIVDAALTRVGMAGFAARQFQTLSGGEQQRVQIARALAQEPSLLVLDEPTSHLDIRGQLNVLTMLRQFAAGGGTVLVALHDLNLVLRSCDRVAVMQDGTVVAEGQPQQILTEALLAKIYGVRARLLDGPEGPVIAYESAV